MRVNLQKWASFIQSHGDLAPPGSEDGCRAPTIAQNIAQSCHLIQPVIIRKDGFTAQGPISVCLSTVKKIVNENLFLICHLCQRNSFIDDFLLAYIDWFMIPPLHVFSSGATEDDQLLCKRICTGHIYRAFLQCAFACVASNFVPCC